MMTTLKAFATRFGVKAVFRCFHRRITFSPSVVSPGERGLNPNPMQRNSVQFSGTGRSGQRVM
jgi:hypothetical protein